MSAQLQVFNIGRGRACIAGVRKGSAAAGTLSGAFYAGYDDGAALPGRFIRSLREKVCTLNRPCPEPFSVTPVHRLKRRVRLRVTGIAPFGRSRDPQRLLTVGERGGWNP